MIRMNEDKVKGKQIYREASILRRDSNKGSRKKSFFFNGLASKKKYFFLNI